MSPAQYYILRQLAKGPLPSAVLLKLDQRPLAGLFARGYFTLTAKLRCEITNSGWEALSACQHAKYRKDSTRPLFSKAHRIAGRATA